VRGVSGEPYGIEHRIIVAGAGRRVCEKAYLEFNEAGEPLGGFGTTQDITGRRRAEQMLRESENSVLRDGRWTASHRDHDTDGRQQFVNSIFGELCGLPVDKLHGDQWVTLFHPEDAVSTDKFLACVRDRRSF